MSGLPDQAQRATDLQPVLQRLGRLLDTVEPLLGQLAQAAPVAREPDWSASAFRWQRRQTPFGSVGELRSIARPATLRLEDLQNVDEQKRLVEANTRQFVRGLPANNVLLTGARGTGKSSLVKACLPTFRDEGLRLVEVDKAQLTDLPEIVAVAGAARTLHCLLRRSVLRAGGGGLQGAEDGAGRILVRPGRQRAGLCHFQPSAPDARDAVRESAGQPSG